MILLWVCHGIVKKFQIVLRYATIHTIAFCFGCTLLCIRKQLLQITSSRLPHKSTYRFTTEDSRSRLLKVVIQKFCLSIYRVFEISESVIKYYKYILISVSAVSLTYPHASFLKNMQNSNIRIEILAIRTSLNYYGESQFFARTKNHIAFQLSDF